MASYNEEYELLLSSIFPPEEYPIIYDTLSRFEWQTTKHHAESFRQHCVDTAHFMEKLCQEKNLLQGTWKGITYARLVGFLHDVGKPFVLKSTKNGTQYFTGHAQVGARLFYLRFQHEIPESILLPMGIAIDSHMCGLRNDNHFAVNFLRMNAVMHMYLPSLNIVPILECLHKADAMGKNPSIQDETPAYLPEPPISYRKSDRIVIYLIGPSGSGKSTLAKKLIDQLSLFGSVDHLERDKVLMQFALQGESYENCRRRVYGDPNLKKEFQECWTDTLYSAKSQILLVDTVQNYYQLETNKFPHHFRIGLYCFPMKFIDRALHGKAPNIEFPPKKWIGYPTLLTENRDGNWQLEVGTGIWQVVPILVKRYLDKCVSMPLEHQPTIMSLWNEPYGVDAIKAQYNPKGITFVNQHSFEDNEIIRVSYLNVTDVTYGPTRYYRGEYLLKTADGLSMLRSGLPTFRSKCALPESFHKIIVTPKYDGSLVNILFVPKEYKHFELLKNQFPEASYPKYGGLLFVGSKQTLMMEKSIRQRFDTAIEMDFETFISQYNHYFKDKMTNLHFEMMVEQENDELTVYYPQNFCKFIGYTTFTDTTRLFTLARPTDVGAVEQYEFDTLPECEKFMEDEHQKLLNGDTSCEPEGFVLYVYENGLKDVIKKKFIEYLAAHNPQFHPDVYKRILEDPVLMKRFQKCRHLKDFLTKVKPLKQELDKFLRADRKMFALYVESNKNKIDNWQRQLDEVTENMRMKPIRIRNILLQHFPDVDNMLDKVFKRFNNFLVEFKNDSTE